MKKFAFLLFSAVTISAVSCKKDEIISMRTNAITQGTWRHQATLVTSIAGDNDITNQLPSRVDSSLYRFDKNNVLLAQITLGSVQGTEESIGTWSLVEADTRMILTDTTFAGDYQVLQLDDTALVIRKRYTADGADSTAMIRRTFKRAS